MEKNYKDIIDLKHWEPKGHSRMPLHNRAAQFAPFAALTGYNEAIKTATSPVKNDQTEDEDNFTKQT